VLSFGPGKLTVADVGKLKYFRACLNESFRVSPTIAYLGRLLPNDLVLRGHLIPAKTFVMWSAAIMGQDANIYNGKC
jgi:cytochrome P450